MPQRLLQSVARGDPAAMGLCIDQYRRLVWSIARRRTRTKTDAEDATQDVFLEIWRHASRFNENLGSEAAFISTIAHRRLIDKCRKQNSDPLLERWSDALGNIDLSVTEGHCSQELSMDADTAFRAVAALRSEQRAVLELSFIYGLSHSEIAKHLQTPIGTVKSLMRRGLLQLKKTLIANDAFGYCEAAASH